MLPGWKIPVYNLRSTQVKSSGKGLVLCSILADSDSKPAKADVDSNGFSSETKGNVDHLTPAISMRVEKGLWLANSTSHPEVIPAGSVPESNFAALQCPEADTHLDHSAGVYAHPNAETVADTLAGSITSDDGVSHEDVALLEAGDATSPFCRCWRWDGRFAFISSVVKLGCYHSPLWLLVYGISGDILVLDVGGEVG
ncbi:hypothetical protein Nepgr_033592 [Nepenthes gracilis]|uniref:Uncharacterized protein n=1 Tax=Nepenthes gracilis TaxID=150966 RepID=A0AAD3TML0_NEPGR|nr:hypothetical protein Nepgr_033592 [Nepenthes gracilis]